MYMPHDVFFTHEGSDSLIMTIDFYQQLGNTPLHLAAIEGHPMVVKHFIDSNADTTIQNKVSFYKKIFLSIINFHFVSVGWSYCTGGGKKKESNSLCIYTSAKGRGVTWLFILLVSPQWAWLLNYTQLHRTRFSGKLAALVTWLEWRNTQASARLTGEIQKMWGYNKQKYL